MSTTKEKILYHRLKKKDKNAFIEAYDLYLDSIYRFVFFKVSNKEIAEDITSSVFLKTWDYIQNNEISNYKTLKALLYKVARNLVIDHYRKESRKQEISYDQDESAKEIVDEKANVALNLEIALDVEVIQSKMKEIKDEYREVIVLKYINELSIAEIAEILGKTRGNVRVLLYRALKTLRDVVENN